MLLCLVLAIKLTDEEIPVAGVWSQADDKLVGMVLRYFSGPSHTFEQQPITEGI